MKCVRCQNDMTECFDLNICFTDGCPITEYVKYSDDCYHWTFHFEEMPDIYVVTGLVNGLPLTQVKQSPDENSTAAGEEELFVIHKEITDITFDRLKKWLVFR